MSDRHELTDLDAFVEVVPKGRENAIAASELWRRMQRLRAPQGATAAATAGRRFVVVDAAQHVDGDGVACDSCIVLATDESEAIDRALAIFNQRRDWQVNELGMNLSTDELCVVEIPEDGPVPQTNEC